MKKSFKKPSIIFVSEHAYAQFVELVKVLLMNFSFSNSAPIYKRKNTIAAITKAKQMMFSPNIVKFFGALSGILMVC
jgi:hypothetical protein